MVRQLLKAARDFSRNPGNVELRLKFHELLGSCMDVSHLQALIGVDYENVEGVTLLRILDLVGDQDLDLFLSLALWSYHFGEDEQAHDWLKRAKIVAPIDERVLSIEIWLNYGASTERLINLCSELLRYYPENEWAKKIKRQLVERGSISEMDSPDLPLRWKGRG